MTKTFKIKGMGCMHCVNNIKTNFGAMECVSSVDISLEGGTMTLAYDESKLNDAVICDKVAELGYTCVV